MINIAINGFGRIGRLVLRAIYENQLQDRFNVVAINDPNPPESMCHLFNFDSIHGTFPYPSSLENDHLIIQQHKIPLFHSRSSNLPWKALDVDILFECSGHFTSKEKAGEHLAAGAKKVLISAPGKAGVEHIVYGVNHHKIDPNWTIISNASCTTNCLAPVLKALIDDGYTINNGLMTTIHAFTKDQCLVDAPHRDLRRARAASSSMIPTKTGAASAIGEVIPELRGKLDGLAIRVPTPNVSLVDVTLTLQDPTTIDAINATMKKHAQSSLKGVLDVCEQPLVSIDFNHNPHSSIVDLTQTRVIGGTTAKLLAWYDNEWGFALRMLDTAAAWSN